MKILIIQQKMIGDVLTSSILFKALREKFPDAQLHYQILPHTKPVIEHDPNIDKFLLFDPEKYGSFTGLFKFSKIVRQEKYDIVIDVYSKINTAIITSLSGAEKRISFYKWYTSYAYTHSFKPKTKLATNAGFAIENRMLLLKGISKGFPDQLKPEIHLTQEEKVTAKNYLQGAGISLEKPLVMIGILGSSPSKSYPKEHMAAVLDYIVAQSSPQLLFNYIPIQKEEVKEIFRLCKPETQEVIFLKVFGRNLREFLAITSFCDALIGNEGGAVNMSKALNVPTFAIFSPQIKKENWSIFEDGRKNVSVHLKDFEPNLLQNLSKKELTKKAADFYELLKPSLIFAKLNHFLEENLR